MMMKNIVENSEKRLRQLFSFLVAVVLVAYVGFMQAQAPAIEWQKSFGGSGIDLGNDIITTSDGGYISIGTTRSNDGDVTGNHGMNDMWVVKLDASGNLQWQKTYGGHADDYGERISETPDGGYIMVGSTRSNDGDVTGHHRVADCWVVKIDNAGTIEWNRALGGFYDDYGWDIKNTADGGYIMSGSASSPDGDVMGVFGAGNFDFWVVKLGNGGNIEWHRTLGGTYADEGESVQQTSDGGYIVGGSTLSNDGDVTGNHALNRDYWVVKLSSTGVLLWQKTLGGSLSDYGQSVLQTLDGGYIIAGYSSSIDEDVTGNHGYDDFWVVKLSSTGQLEWQKSLGGSQTENANSIKQQPNGSYLIAGYTLSLDGTSDGDVTGNHGTQDFWVVKLDTSGNMVWQKTMGGSFMDFAESIAVTPDGGSICIGATYSSDGDVIGGSSFPSYNFWIVKLGPGTLAVPKPHVITVSVFPNPVKDRLQIKTSESIERIKIHNLLGQTVYDETHQETEISLKTEHFYKGIYMVEVISGNRSEVYKILKN